MAGASACSGYCLPGDAIAACNTVLVVCADNPWNCAEVQSTLRGTGAFTTVDTFAARSIGSGGSGAPAAALLASYHAVLVYSSYFEPFGDAVLLGDRLAAFHDQGGGVVVTADAVSVGLRLQGAYGSPANGYALLDYASGPSIGPSDSLGAVLEPQSPLMTGVASLAATEAYRSTASVVRGEVVARWAGGGQEPLVLRGTRGNRTLVELNFYPPSSTAFSAAWTGDGAALLRNGLKYSRCMLCGAGRFAAAGAGNGGCGGEWGLRRGAGERDNERERERDRDRERERERERE